MYEELILENVVVINRAALIVYLLLAGIVGWAFRAVAPRRWWRRFEVQDVNVYQYPQQNHTYLEYVPEVTTRSQTPVTEGSVAVPVSGTAYDLKIVKGIDHIVESILNKAGIATTEDLANTPASEIREILGYAGINHQDYDPTTWPHQAHLAYHEKWDELKRYQDFLNLR